MTSERRDNRGGTAGTYARLRLVTCSVTLGQVGGLLAGLPRAARMGCVGILDVVLAQGDKGVPVSSFARAIPEEKVAELLSSLQYAGAIRMGGDGQRVYPGYNLEQTIRLVSNIKGT